MELISSSEAREQLKVSTSTFKRLVDTGKIRKVTPPNKRQGMYIKEDVDRVADEMRPFIEYRRHGAKPDNRRSVIPTEVDWQKISDLPAILKLDLKVYNERIVGDIGLYISWEKKNPQITLLSFEKGNRENVLAYVSLVPLPEHIILSILRGEREELSISPEEVENYDREGAYTLLAESVVTHPDHPEQLNIVLREVLNYWCQQYPTRYIEKIYAQAATDLGDYLVRKLYFSPLYTISDNAYVLDLKRPGISRLVKRFQECLKSKESQLQRETTTEKNTAEKRLLHTTAEEYPTTFSKASRKDIPTCVELSQKTFPNLRQGIASVETRLTWLEKNPDLFYVVKRANEVVGYTGIIPMKPEKIQKILTNEESLRDLGPEEILEFKPGIPLHVYAMTMVTKPGISKAKKRAYGSSLIAGLVTTITELGNKGITIDTLYGRSNTVDGIRIMRRLGFTQVPSVTNMQNFALKVQESNLIREYRQAVIKNGQVVNALRYLPKSPK